MKSQHLSGLVIFLWAILACTVPSGAGAIGPAAFGPGAVIEGFTGLGLPLDNAAPRVIGGNTYSTNDGKFRYYDFSYAGCTGECIGTNSELGFMDVAFASPALRVGGYVSVDYDWSATVSFFDGTSTLLGSLLLGGGASVAAFAGWEDAGLIARMRVTDTASNSRITMLDNVITESQSTSPIPEPTTLTCLSLALAGLAARRGARIRHR
jgi:hypothetical protein